MWRRMLFVVTAIAAAGCASPEAQRQRGGGPGGDIGNRPEQVKMHEGSRMYWETPLRIGEAMEPLAPSEQARTLSLPDRAEGDGAGQ